MKCVQCGSENSANAKFCRGCGRKLEIEVVAPVPSTSSMVQCSKCGNANEVGKKFCPKCGASLIPGAAIPATPVPTQPSAAPRSAKSHATASPQPETVAIELPPATGGLSKAVVGGVIAAALLATAGGGGYWYYQKREAEKVFAAEKQRQEVARPKAEAQRKVEARNAKTSVASSSIATCANITDCYKATLLAMTNSDIETVRSIAEKIDTFEKPPRGNRVVARKLNDEALSAMKQNDFAQAARIFTKAQREDPSDVEIASNLGSARVRAGDFVGANETLIAALQLNPRRTSTWVPIAELIARRDQNTNGAVSALLVAYEWSTAKEKAVNYYTAQSGTETHPQLRAAYEQALMRVPR